MMLTPKIKSEVNRLKSVLIHEPGIEVEAVTPANVNVALYGDILNMSVAKMEYSQFRAVLKKCCTVYELKDLFTEAISKPGNKVKFVQEYIDGIKGAGIEEKLLKQECDLLFDSIVEGIPFNKLSLTNFLNQDRFAVTPLHNLFFTRDTSFCVGDTLYISKMAKEIRHPEAQFIKGVLKMNAKKESSVVDLSISDVQDTSIEGGDVLVADEDILIIGISERTKSTSIDRLISTL
ncbi:MAG: arginine deiminase family protein, partial [Bacteroidales bacterium]|nr:arginine deiminase family protein [Bacteroidales bacterium]